MSPGGTDGPSSSHISRRVAAGCDSSNPDPIPAAFPCLVSLVLAQCAYMHNDGSFGPASIQRARTQIRRDAPARVIRASFHKCTDFWGERPVRHGDGAGACCGPNTPPRSVAPTQTLPYAE